MNSKDNRLIWESFWSEPTGEQKDKAYAAGKRDFLDGADYREVNASDTWGPLSSYWEAGYNAARKEATKPERWSPSQDDIDKIEHYRSDAGKAEWQDMVKYVSMNPSDWSNTMAYLMTGKGPGDYGDRLD